MLKIIVCFDYKANASSDTTEAFINDLTDCFYQQRQSAYLCLNNDFIKPAEPLAILNTTHPKQGFICFWQQTPQLPQGLSNLLAKHQVTFQDYIACESKPLSLDKANFNNQSKRVALKHFHQVALLKKPEALSHQQFLDTWLNDHTTIAIETQSTFSYTQNILNAVKQRGEWPLMDAMVEESFPLEAMTNREVFFNSAGNEEQMNSRQQTMINSCLRFIDFDNFDCISTQQVFIN